MSQELEIKIKVDSHDPVRETLQQCGGEFQCCVLEVNRLFDDMKGDLRKRGIALRIRGRKSIKGPEQHACLTYKGPAHGGYYKSREEHEVDVSDEASLLMILRNLGYRETFLFEKRRETWKLGDATVELDEVPNLGTFVEVEAASREQIDSICSQLGLDRSAAVEETYAGLLATNAVDKTFSRMEVRFKP